MRSSNKRCCRSLSSVVKRAHARGNLGLPQPDARCVGQPEPAAFGLFIGDFQPLASPDALDPLVVDYPVRLAQQTCDLAIAVAAVLPGKLDNIGRQTLFVLTTARELALCRAMLS